VPEALSDTVRLGSRVHVPFGHSTARGYVVGFAEHSDRHDLKSIAALISPKPLINETDAEAGPLDCGLLRLPPLNRPSAPCCLAPSGARAQGSSNKRS